VRPTRRTFLGSALAGVAGSGCRREAVMANHVVLLGDSIFDNAAYVGRGPAVIDQVREQLPSDWKATLLARDGAVTRGVIDQARRVPADASHLVVSVGGNDALRESGILTRPARSAAEIFAALADIRDRFADDYRIMLDAVLTHGKPAAVCTVYDGNMPDARQQRMASAGLTAFNDAIARAAVGRGLPVLDLRMLFTAPEDYANPIEPSSVGGAKIARAIAGLVAAHDFTQKRATFYAQ
jgi:lysophospholipase L1-like esterase